jgi:hypothetical protein
MTPSSFPMRSWPLASPLRHQGCKASEVEQARVHCNSYHPGCLASSRDLEILRGHQGDGDMSDRKRPAGCSRTVSARLVTGLMTLRCFSEPCSEQVTRLSFPNNWLAVVWRRDLYLRCWSIPATRRIPF